MGVTDKGVITSISWCEESSAFEEFLSVAFLLQTEEPLFPIFERLALSCSCLFTMKKVFHHQTTFIELGLRSGQCSILLSNWWWGDSSTSFMIWLCFTSIFFSFTSPSKHSLSLGGFACKRPNTILHRFLVLDIIFLNKLHKQAQQHSLIKTQERDWLGQIIHWDWAS